MTAGWLLAIDTSSDYAGVALYDGAACHQRNWLAGRHQTTTVMEAIERLTRSFGVGPDQIGAAAVAIGPGSFSGLRVGLGIAKGLSIARNVELIGVDTLVATAHPFLAEDRVVAVIRAGRTRLVWSERECQEHHSGTFDELVTRLANGPRTLVVGEIDEAQADALRAIGMSVPDAGVRNRTAESLARIGHSRWLAGCVDNPVTLEPIYVHQRGG